MLKDLRWIHNKSSHRTVDMNTILVADGGVCLDGSTGAMTGRGAGTGTQRCLDLPPCSALGYDFKVPVDVQALAGDDPLLPELVATQAFQRLKDIRFLGGIDYCFVPRPNGSQSATRYTRQQHSLGVLRLAHLYCKELQIDQKQRQPICAAALLHDIGHPPLSHSMEPAFEECLGFEHHQATEDIVLGRVPLGKEVLDVLRSHNVSPDKVVSIMSGEGGERFFHGPINFDTIEAICRSYNYLQTGTALPSPDDIMLAALYRSAEEHREIVDNFWLRKNEVYECLIGSRRAALADLACQTYLRRHAEVIKNEDYFGTESGVFAKLTGLRDLLVSPRMEQRVADQIGGPWSLVRRRYFVDKSANFFRWKDEDRYRYSRCVRELDLRPERTGEEGK